MYVVVDVCEAYVVDGDVGGEVDEYVLDWPGRLMWYRTGQGAAYGRDITFRGGVDRQDPR